MSALAFDGFAASPQSAFGECMHAAGVDTHVASRDAIAESAHAQTPAAITRPAPVPPQHA